MQESTLPLSNLSGPKSEPLTSPNLFKYMNSYTLCDKNWLIKINNNIRVIRNIKQKNPAKI